MSPLTPDQKRTITGLLGYRLQAREGIDKGDLIGPDGRHRGVFRISRATDLWVWNDAVFSFDLYRDPQGAVHCSCPAPSGRPALRRIWPEPGEEPQELSDKALAGYERLSGSQVI